MAELETIPGAYEVWLRVDDQGIKSAVILHPCLTEDRRKLASQGYQSKKVFRHELGGHNEAHCAAMSFRDSLLGVSRGKAKSTFQLSQLWSWIPGLGG